MTPRAYTRRNRLLLFALGILFGAVVLLLRHGAMDAEPNADYSGQDARPLTTRVAEALRGLAGEPDRSGPAYVPAAESPTWFAGSLPEVLEAELIRQGYFEATVRVRYTAGPRHAAERGYLYLFERDNPRTNGVGAFVKEGTHTARVFLNRRLARKGAYTSGQIVALMYRYGKAETPFFEQDIPLQLQWPGLQEVGVRRKVERYPDVRQLQIFRNIPRYEEFALDLVERGFPAGQMTILYAPCRKCRAGLHFGRNTRVEVLQEILRALRSHEFPVQWIDYDASRDRFGQVLVGWTPTKQARPLWKHLDALLQEDLTLQEFTQIVGLKVE